MVCRCRPQGQRPYGQGQEGNDDPLRERNRRQELIIYEYITDVS